MFCEHCNTWISVSKGLYLTGAFFPCSFSFIFSSFSLLPMFFHTVPWPSQCPNPQMGTKVLCDFFQAATELIYWNEYIWLFGWPADEWECKQLLILQRYKFNLFFWLRNWFSQTYSFWCNQTYIVGFRWFIEKVFRGKAGSKPLNKLCFLGYPGAIWKRGIYSGINFRLLLLPKKSRKIQQHGKTQAIYLCNTKSDYWIHSQPI